MIITKLHIEDYKGLKKLDLLFTKQISVFIGINGSGKSSILEFLSLFFSLAYEQFILKKKDIIIPESLNNSFVEYWLRFETETEKESMRSKFNIDYIPVKLSVNKEGRFETEIVFEEKNDFFFKELSHRYKDLALLPTRIITYYSGISKHQKQIHSSIEDYVLRQFRQNPAATKEGYIGDIKMPMFLFDTSDFGLLLAGLWSFGYVDRILNLFQKLQIYGSVDDLIIIKISKVEFDKQDYKKQQREIERQIALNPEVYNDIQNPRTVLLLKYEKEREDNFFGASGRLGAFLKQLRETCLNSDSVYDEFVEDYTFLFDINRWRILSEDILQNPKMIFELLLMLKHNGLLKSITVNLIKNDIKIKGEALSEGEKQAIIITALNEILGTTNSLFLFDEPDNYLHPSLQDDLIINIEDNNHTDEMLQNHYLITTHNPSFINNFNDDTGELFIMNNGMLHEHHLKWYGRDVNDITYQIMGSEMRPLWAEKEIQEVDKLLDGSNIENGEIAFQELKKKLSPQDIDVLRLQTKLDFLKD